MSQIETEKEILEISLEDLKNKGLPEVGELSSPRVYLVEESDHPQCILKQLPQVKGDLVLKANPRRDGWRIFRGIDYELKSERWWKDREVEKIKILTDVPPAVTLKKATHAWENRMFKVDFNYGFKMEISVNSCHPKEVGDSVYLSFGNSIFTIDELLSSYDSRRFKESASLERAMHVIRSMPVDNRLVFSNHDLLNKIIKTLGITEIEKIEGKLDGISKTFSKVKEFYEKETDLSRAFSFFTLAANSKMTINSVKSSVVFNKLFQEVETEEDFRKVCDKMREVHLENSSASSNYYYVDLDARSFIEKLMDKLEDAREIKKAALKRKSTGAFNKIMNDLEFVNIDEKLYPLTHEAVHSGDVPLGTFFRKNGESYFVYNDNWELWEMMLKEHREVAIQVANSCSGRTTYEKDIMSYFYFTLIELPEYLEQRTGRKWKGIPKLVNTADELEPPKVGDAGTAKTRSALTPIVNNEKSEVVVPYVSMRIGGYQTTYCYGLTYSVLKKGFSYMGNTVMKDVEKALNGRDDYGLMFYTLTGSAQGRGYPTFLIIFEDLTKPYESSRNIKVHFHRVHPTRSKGGDYNPVHNWTVGCYKWMIGNVNFERIQAQQGDLAFVQIDKFPEGEPEKVNGYDSHMFETPVDYLPYTKKDNQNVLGYVKLEKTITLNHVEHMSRTLPAGTYEIRQCRSWEANPKGVWTLRID